MFANSASEVLVMEALRRAKANEDTARKLNTQNRLNVYNDDFKTLIQSELARQFTEETFQNIKLMVDDSNNVLKRIVNDISTVYKEGAQRVAGIEQADGKLKPDLRYGETIRSQPTDLLLDKTNKLCNVCNEVFVRVAPANGITEY